jgi:membrane fusion protein, multidrug efflux system
MTTAAARSMLLERGVQTEQPPAQEVDGLPQQGQPRKTPNWSKLLKVAIAILLVGCAAVAGFRWYQEASSHEETDDAAVQGHIHIISPRLAGIVAEVLVDDNQFVKKGQLLVKLDPTDFQIAVDQAQAALESARRQADAAGASIPQVSQIAVAESTKAKGSLTESQSAIASAKALVDEAESVVPAARARVAETEAILDKTRADYQRYIVLEQQGAISKQQLDEAKASYVVAENSRKQAQESVKQAQSRLSQAQQAVAKAQAQLLSSHGQLQQAAATQLQTAVTRRQFEATASGIAQAAAALRNAEQQLQYTNITAPVSGQIGRKAVEAGQHLQPGQQILAIVPSDFWIVANFKETQLERMVPGQPVSIKVDSFPHHQFTGKVESLSPASGAKFALLPPDNATGNFTKIVQRVPVKILFDSQSLKGFESRIAPGMSTVVSVSVK